MANERTFLAWLRTSLSFITIGVGIVQLFRLKGTNEEQAIKLFGKVIGVGFILLGILTLIMGCLRYFRVQSMLLSLYYPASQYSVILLVGGVFVLIFATLVIVFANG